MNVRVIFCAARGRGDDLVRVVCGVQGRAVIDARREPDDSAEDIAALLDGTASATEREMLLRRLAGSPELHATLVEAMAIRTAMQAVNEAGTDAVAQNAQREDAPPSDSRVPTSVPRWSQGRIVAVCALLAASLGVVVYLRVAQNAPKRDVIQIAEATQIHGARGAGSLSRVLGADWDAPTWAVVRGDASAREQSSRTFRAGVRVAQLFAASNANDAPAVTDAAQRLRELLVASAGSAPLSMQLSELAATGGFSDVRVRGVLAEQLRTVLGDADWFDLGVWIETARLAAVDHQPAFFADTSQQTSQLTAILRRSPEPRADWSTATLPLRDVPMHARSGDMTALVAVLNAVAMRAGS
jgi:hypothetical protein